MTKLLLRLFVKDHADLDDPGVRSRVGKLSGLVGIVCNLMLCGAKLLLGVLSGSVSITADALNNLTDAGSSVVTMVGFRLSERPADADHPYGHARMEYLSGLIVAALILLIGWELARSSVDKILHPQPVQFHWGMILVLLLSMGGKLWLSLFNRTLGRAIDSSALLAVSADSRNDVISTAAVLVSCLVGKFTSFDPDGYMGLLVAIFILFNGVSIARETVDPLLGAAPGRDLVEAIRNKLLSQEHVLGIHDLMVHDYGPGRRFASVHVEMDRNLDPLFSHNIIDELEREFLHQMHIHLVIHYDPTVTDDEELLEAKRFAEGVLQEIDPALTLHDFRMVPGPMHTNLIFDVVVPFARQKDAEGLCAQIAGTIHARRPDHYAVLHCDSEAFN